MKTEKPKKPEAKEKKKMKKKPVAAPKTTTVKKESKAAAPKKDGITAAMEKISGKWKLWILFVLREGKKMRFSEIKREIPGINDVMLSQSLKDLVESGLAQREQMGDVPSRVTYRLTSAGKGIVPALEALEAWGETIR